MLKVLLRYNILCFVAMIILLPGLFALIVAVFGQKALFKWMSHNYKLSGMVQQIDSPTLDFQHFTSHEAQKYLELSLTNQLPLRSLFIRINNQIYYSIFNKANVENGWLVIGKHQQTLTNDEIISYCFKKRNINDLRLWADKLYELSQFFEKRGKIFIYLMTPSKAEFMPELIPSRYHCQNNGISQHVTDMENLLKAKHIHYINGPSLLLSLKNNHKNITLFPKVDFHWNDLAVVLGANAIIDMINETKALYLRPIIFDYTMVTQSHGYDHAVQGLFNLLYPNNHYPTPKISYHPSTISSQTYNAALIGSSFLGQLAEVFWQNGTFTNISYYRYFKLDKTDLIYGQPRSTPLPLDLADRNILNAILDANVVILEENSAMILSNHGQLFYEVMKKQNGVIS